jgi:hypothetical protein
VSSRSSVHSRAHARPVEKDRAGWRTRHAGGSMSMGARTTDAWTARKPSYPHPTVEARHCPGCGASMTSCETKRWLGSRKCCARCSHPKEV